MHGIYNSDTLEKLINTVHEMHNKTMWNKTLFAGKLDNWYHWYLFQNVVAYYAINSLLYITMMREKYIKMYAKFPSCKCMPRQ